MAHASEFSPKVESQMRNRIVYVWETNNITCGNFSKTQHNEWNLGQTVVTVPCLLFQIVECHWSALDQSLSSNLTNSSPCGAGPGGHMELCFESFTHELVATLAAQGWMDWTWVLRSDFVLFTVWVPWGHDLASFTCGCQFLALNLWSSHGPELCFMALWSCYIYMASFWMVSLILLSYPGIRL